MNYLNPPGKVLNRRKFVLSVGTIGAGTLLSSSKITGLTTRCAEDAKDGDPLLKAGPYIQFSNNDSMTIRWITQLPCYSWINFGEKADNPDQNIDSVKDGLVDANNRVHAITIRELMPGRTYYYRICSRPIIKFEPYGIEWGETFMSPVYSFVPMNNHSGSSSFVVFNDIHDRPESFQQLLQYQSSGKKDFYVFNGDIFGHLQQEDQIVLNMLKPFTGLSAETPLVYVRGNHETRGVFARNITEYFNRSQQGFYYSFSAGPVRYIILDSGEDKPDDNQEYSGLVRFDAYRMAQREWLKNEIKTGAFRNARYRIVFCHIPPFYAGDWHGTMHCREMWAELFNEAGITALIAGHTHKFGIHLPAEGHSYPIILGGGPKDGKRTIIEGTADRQSVHITIRDDTGLLKDEITL